MFPLRLRFSSLLPSVMATLSGVLAQAAAESHIRNSAQYEAAAQPLRDAPADTFQFSAVRLSDVLHMLADDAGINFISLPGDKNDASRLVTFRFEMSPFSALETLAQDNGIALVYNDGGLWSLKPSNSSELVAKSYYIRYNTKEKIEVTNSASSGGGSSGGSYGGNAGGGYGGAGGGLGPSTGINLQGNGGSAFEVEPSQLIDDVKEILNISSDNISTLLTNEAYLQAMRAPGASANVLSPLNTNIVNSGDNENSAKVLWPTRSS